MIRRRLTSKQREELYDRETSKAREAAPIHIGDIFERLTIRERVKHPKRSGVFFICECECGTRKTVYAGHLRGGNTKSCGCGAHKHLRPPLTPAPCAGPGCIRRASNWHGHDHVCDLHNQRLKKYGNFELPDRRRTSDGKCAVLGCCRPLHSANLTLCRTHYFRIRRNSAKGLQPLTLDCAFCGNPLSKGQQEYCSARCCWRAYQGFLSEKTCVACGSVFDFFGCELTCSDACSESIARRHKQTRRALESSKNRYFEVFADIEIFRRDKWICQLCGLPINQFLKAHNRAAATIDHIVPLSRGGLHRRSNVQTAHFSCNSRKRDKLPVELNNQKYRASLERWINAQAP